MQTTKTSGICYPADDITLGVKSDFSLVMSYILQAESSLQDCQNFFFSERGICARKQISLTNDPLKQSMHQLDLYGPDLRYNTQPLHGVSLSWANGRT
jgi:hypothetical protein